MKILKESLFDTDIISDEITTLYDLFGNHIRKYKHVYGEGMGWTHFFNQPAVVREWKKEGRKQLSGGFSKTTFPPDLQKFISVILNNVHVSKKQILHLPEDGNLDDETLNKILTSYDIILKEGDMYGSTDARTYVKVQIGYMERTPADPGHSIEFRTVGTKHFKGLNTDKIDITIYCYTPSRPGFGRHIFALGTDISIKDLK